MIKAAKTLKMRHAVIASARLLTDIGCGEDGGIVDAVSDMRHRKGAPCAVGVRLQRPSEQSESEHRKQLSPW